MQTITTIGLDIAKSVFQVHGVDGAGQEIIRRQLKRRYVLAFFQKLTPCLVGMEACASSHHWSRELQALGHTVRLIPPAYVKPYVKRQKNDAADAEAICEAVTRANMRFVPTKTPEQQSGLVLHRARHLFLSARTSAGPACPPSPTPASGRAFLQIMRSFERTPAFEQGIKAALKARKFPAQIIWGKDDPALRMNKYAPHLLKALDIESYEAVYGKHFLQEDSSPAIASLIARLISASGSAGESL